MSIKGDTNDPQACKGWRLDLAQGRKIPAKT